MIGKSFITAGAVFLVAVCVPGMAGANNLNVTVGTHMPIRPHVNLNNTINVDVKIRAFREIDLSQKCGADERIKAKGNREWRCRKDR